MDKLKHLIQNHHRTKEQVQHFLNLLLTKKLPCVTLVSNTGTSIIHKICKIHKNGSCSKECYAAKSPLREQNKEEEHDKLIEKAISKKFQYSPAANHFNQVIDVLESEIGSLIILEYEDKYLHHFSTLGDIVRYSNIDLKTWKIINFQFILSFALAQKTIDGYTHNDTHLNNILLVPNYKNIKFKYTTSKRTLQVNAPFIVKIIDLEQSLAKSPKYQTSVGKFVWKKTVWQNKIFDFLRFAFWSVFFISLRENDGHGLPSWYQDWLDFILRWLDSRYFLLGNDPYAQVQFIDLAPNVGKKVTPEGGKWLQFYYGPHSKYISNIGDILNDSFFDDLEI